MKHLFNITLITLLALTPALHAQASSKRNAEPQQELKFSEQKPEVGDKEYLYEIKNQEIIVNDKLITLFAFSKDGISVSYRNKTDKEAKPRYTFKAYNRYGMLIGECKVGNSIIMFGSSTRMEPGAVSSEKLNLEAFPLKKILQFSRLPLPADLEQMKWVILSDTNSR